MFGRINWKEFIIDCGDTIGGIFIGVSFDALRNLPKIFDETNKQGLLFLVYF